VNMNSGKMSKLTSQSIRGELTRRAYGVAVDELLATVPSILVAFWP